MMELQRRYNGKRYSGIRDSEISWAKWPQNAVLKLRYSNLYQLTYGSTGLNSAVFRDHNVNIEKDKASEDLPNDYGAN